MIRGIRRLRYLFVGIAAAASMLAWTHLVEGLAVNPGAAAVRGRVVIQADPLPFEAQPGETVSTELHAYPASDPQHLGDEFPIVEAHWKALLPADGEGDIQITPHDGPSGPDGILNARFTTAGKYIVTILCQVTCMDGSTRTGAQDITFIVKAAPDGSTDRMLRPLFGQMRMGG